MNIDSPSPLPDPQAPYPEAGKVLIDSIDAKLANFEQVIDSPAQKKKLMQLLIDGLMILQATEQDDYRLNL